MLAIFIFLCCCAILFSIIFLWYYSYKVKEQQVLNELQIISLQDRISHLESELNDCTKRINDFEFKEDFNYFSDNLGIFD